MNQSNSLASRLSVNAAKDFAGGTDNDAGYKAAAREKKGRERTVKSNGTEGRWNTGGKRKRENAGEARAGAKKGGGEMAEGKRRY